MAPRNRIDFPELPSLPVGLLLYHRLHGRVCVTSHAWQRFYQHFVRFHQSGIHIYSKHELQRFMERQMLYSFERAKEFSPEKIVNCTTKAACRIQLYDARYELRYVLSSGSCPALVTIMKGTW